MSQSSGFIYQLSDRSVFDFRTFETLHGLRADGESWFIGQCFYSGRFAADKIIFKITIKLAFRNFL